METNRLRQLRVIGETGSLRRAAELLRTSHGALSKSMRVLEHEIGATLFVREGRGLHFTEAGTAVLKQAALALDGIDRVIAAAKSPPSSGPELRLATFEVFSTYFLAVLARDYLPKEAPLLVVERGPGALEEALLAGDADVGLTTIPSPRGGIDYLRVTSARIGLYRRPGSFRGTSFDALPFAVPVTKVTDAPEGVVGLDGWPEDRAPRRVLYRVEMMETVLALCRHGAAVACLPSFIVDLHNETTTPPAKLVELAAPAAAGDLQQPVYLVKRSGTPEGKRLKTLARALRMTCGGR